MYHARKAPAKQKPENCEKNPEQGFCGGFASF
jgi:hypothetical protein